MLQVEPTEVEKWTKVEYKTAANSSDSDAVASGVVISIFQTNRYEASRISHLTVDACLPRTRNTYAQKLNSVAERVTVTRPRPSKNIDEGSCTFVARRRNVKVLQK